MVHRVRSTDKSVSLMLKQLLHHLFLHEFLTTLGELAHTSIKGWSNFADGFLVLGRIWLACGGHLHDAEVLE